jgi:DNA-binding protein H-NS
VARKPTATAATAATAAATQSKPDLNSMSIDELIALRQEVSASLDERVIEQRRSLETELAKLTRFHGGTPRSKSGAGARTPVAPKYRNLENPSETWAGRGLTPLWLKAAIEAGKSLDDFLISNAAQPKKPERRAPLRRART